MSTYLYHGLQLDEWEVRDALQKQISEFEKANNLDQTKTAEERAANIMVESGILITQMCNWISATGIGLKTRLVPPISFNDRYLVLQAAFHVLQAAYSTFGLVSNWAILSSSQRATVILQTLQMVTDGISSAMDSWKQFMNGDSQPADTATALEKLNESPTKYGEDGAFREKLGDRVTGDGIPSSEETIIEDDIWDELLDEPAAEVPPGDNFDPAPDPQLTYARSPSQIAANNLTSIWITATNDSANQVSIPFITITLLGGGDPLCLFKHDIDDTITLASDTDGSKDTARRTFPFTTNMVNELRGTKKRGENSLSILALGPGQSFSSVWTGYINDRGDDDDSSWNYIDIVVSTEADKTNKVFYILRK
ncbi:hypothetical protein BDV23DRAFT_187935 [Aspergillus alliaceus]|uniref:Uncharacterized protein n=1 Tax=Petromyces alliaceus TaxID=209559 RepID=A0A5N7BVB5_PETAA|nr:hypothetical protein BDV23DRAFT_187935 [Aspergillus alliaceus]